MKWIFIEGEAINVSLVKHFEWRTGLLHIWFLGDREPTVFLDPEKHLCANLMEEAFR